MSLARGLAVTLRTMTRRSVTAQYPDVPPALPPRSRGVIALLEENCTVCMLCSRECPDWCIYIDSHKETVASAAPGARPRTRNVLDRFAIDFALCMYCGICIEVCPFDALFWSPEFEYAEYDICDLTHEKERLREWMWTVPPPPALDPEGEQPKELAAAAGGPRPAARTGRAAAAGRAAETGRPAVRERPDGPSPATGRPSPTGEGGCRPARGGRRPPPPPRAAAGPGEAGAPEAGPPTDGAPEAGSTGDRGPEEGPE